MHARFHLDISRGFGITGTEPRTQRQTGSLLGCKSPDYQAEYSLLTNNLKFFQKQLGVRRRCQTPPNHTV